MPSNGAKVVVALVDSDYQYGYVCTVHAMSRRNKLVEKICDMFEAGAVTLSDEDLKVIEEYKAKSKLP